ncbi:hypothetical protein SHIRM173S_04287 [Streptomyces hirsutus]
MPVGLWSHLGSLPQALLLAAPSLAPLPADHFGGCADGNRDGPLQRSNHAEGTEQAVKRQLARGRPRRASPLNVETPWRKGKSGVMASGKRKFDAEFREGAVRIMTESGKPVPEVDGGVVTLTGVSGRRRVGAWPVC